MRVALRDGESFDSLLRRFKAGVAKHGIISDFKRHQTFMSKGQKARAKEKRAERKRLSKKGGY
ncbi:MAG: 30S ribosomal protein S21 [Chloroflexi bacterium]|nr:30S ribosomal protein S21 [Candidatus Methylomirabilis oxyfera]MBI4322343.1 30S ribosomal protein S21 [Chloroflexota bacterium]